MLAAAVAVVAGPASSAHGLAYTPPAEVGPLHLEVQSAASLVMESGTITLDCSETRLLDLRCEAEATYRIRNDGNDVLVRLATALPRGRGLEHHLDGERIEDDDVYEPGVTLRIPPGEHTLVASGTVRLEGASSFVVPAVYGRHIAFGSRPSMSFPIRVAHVRDPQPEEIGPWASFGPTELELRLPAGWQRSELESERPGHQLIRLERTDTVTFVNGGPLLGVTSIVDGGERARVGYEIGLGEWVLAAIELETDFRNVLITAPRVGLTIPFLNFLPSPELSLGIPVRIGDGTRVGGRLSLGVAIFFARFVTTFDYYPSGDLWEIGLGGTVSI